MRALTVMELDAVSGGNGKSFLQNIGQCTVDTLAGGAAGAALGLATAPVTAGLSVKPLIVLGLIGGNLGSDACNALPKGWPS